MKNRENKNYEMFDESVITGEVKPTEKELDAFRKFIGERPKLTEVQKVKYKLKGFESDMERYIHQDKLSEIVPVGSFIKECIRITGLKNKQIAELLGVTETNLSAMLNGRRRLVIEHAYLLGQLFNTKGKYFIDIQNKNEWFKFMNIKSNNQDKVKLENYLEAS